MSEVKQGQVFMDKVIAQTGSWENALEVAILNDKSITDDLSRGENIKVNTTSKSNVVVNFFNSNDEPATELSQVQKIDLEDLGIGRMIIKDSFIIR